jgi:transposase
MTYPLKFRLHILQVQEAEGLNDSETARQFRISLSSLRRWHVKPEPVEKRHRQSRIDMAALAREVAAYPDDYQYERAQRFGLSQRGMCSALKRLDVTIKKKSGASESG